MYSHETQESRVHTFDASHSTHKAADGVEETFSPTISLFRRHEARVTSQRSLNIHTQQLLRMNAPRHDEDVLGIRGQEL